jgi:K+-sensing histidine kinase KdpD
MDRGIGGIRELLTGDVRPLPATAVGLAAVVAIALVFGPLHADVARSTEALALVVPVVGAAVAGGRRAAYAVAAAATVAFSFLIPPVGSVRVQLTQDLVALVVFGVVAVAVGALVASRIEILGRIERQRSALLRSVSHDLRTPLAVILAVATELLDVDSVGPEASRDLGLIAGEAARLDRLVANLLSLGRIEAGALRPVKHPVDIGELLAHSVNRLARLFEGVTLDIEAPDELPAVDLDFVLVEQLVTNLLENARRHSPPGGVIRVSVRRVSRGLDLVVSDDGPGVDPAERAAIFEPFRSGALAGSSGIGLAICEAVAEAHGGSIGVGESSTGGAEFTVFLPI